MDLISALSLFGGPKNKLKSFNLLLQFWGQPLNKVVKSVRAQSVCMCECVEFDELLRPELIQWAMNINKQCNAFHGQIQLCETQPLSQLMQNRNVNIVYTVLLMAAIGCKKHPYGREWTKEERERENVEAKLNAKNAPWIQFEINPVITENPRMVWEWKIVCRVQVYYFQ